MNIVILQGSPNVNGSTAILVEEFARGARQAGHSVERFDVDKMDIAPCTGCVRCGYEGPCVQHDDMDAPHQKPASRLRPGRVAVNSREKEQA